MDGSPTTLESRAMQQGMEEEELEESFRPKRSLSRSADSGRTLDHAVGETHAGLVTAAVRQPPRKGKVEGNLLPGRLAGGGSPSSSSVVAVTLGGRQTGL